MLCPVQEGQNSRQERYPCRRATVGRRATCSFGSTRGRRRGATPGEIGSITPHAACDYQVLGGRSGDRYGVVDDLEPPGRRGPNRDASFPITCTTVANSHQRVSESPDTARGLDHFLCYQVTSDQFTPPVVDLTDQFGVHDQVQPLSASSPHAWDNQLCNPVTEVVGGRFNETTGPVYGVSNPGAHLYCYTDSGGASPSVNVSVQNQLGTGSFTVRRPTRLRLALMEVRPQPGPFQPPGDRFDQPERAGADPSTLNLNHFQCYGVVRSATGGFSRRPWFVQLTDQFGTTTAIIGAPRELCAPVIKQVVSATGAPVGAASTINDDGVDGADLLCYSVFAWHPRNVEVGNQFSASAASAVPTPVPVRVRYADQLCLPSFKTLIPASVAPEVPNTLLLPLAGALVGAGALAVHRRRRTTSTR